MSATVTRRRSASRLLSIGLASALTLFAAPLVGVASAAGSTIDTITPTGASSATTDVLVTFSGYTSALAPDTMQLVGATTTVTGTGLAASTTTSTAHFNLSGQPSGLYQAVLKLGPVMEASSSCPSTCFTVGPAVTSIVPTSGLNTGSQSVTVNGSGIVAGATMKISHAGQPDIAATGVTGSGTSLTGTLNLTKAAPLGGWAITVTNPDSGSGTCGCTFAVAGNQPTVTAASSSTRPVGATAAAVTLTGTNFSNGATVTFTDPKVTASSVNVTSTTSLSFNVTVAGDATPGAKSLTVTTLDGQTGTCAACFSVSAVPTVTTISPTTIGQGATNRTITVNGTGFTTGATVSFSGTFVTAGATNVAGNGQSLTVPVSATSGAATTTRTVTVTNPDGGTVTSGGLLTVDAGPTVASANPSSRGQGTTATTVTLTGTGFVDPSGPAVISINPSAGITLTNPTWIDATHVSVDVAVGALVPSGPETFTVVNPDGGTGSGQVFAVGTAPVVTSASFGASGAATGQGSSARSLTLTGTNFVAGATVTFSPSAGITPGTVVVNSATHITVPVTVTTAAAVGTHPVTVTNVDAGAGTLASGISVTAAPTAVSLAPSSLGQGASNHTVVVTGSGFQPGAIAAFSGLGVTVDSLVVDSATQLTLHVSVTNSATGTRDLTVTNTDGGTATAPALLGLNTAPTVTSAAPSSLSRGATATVTITGTGFVTNATVAVVGGDVTVSDVVVSNNGATITATFAVDGAAATTARDVTVTNPDGGVGTGVDAFTVNPAPTVTLVEGSPGNNTVSNAGTSPRTITFTGTRFLPGATLTLHLSGQSDVIGTSVNVSSGTTATASFAVTALAPGSWDGVFTNADGSTGTCSGCLNVISGGALALTSVTPAFGGDGASGLSLALLGSNFSNGMTVTFANTGVHPTSVSVTDSSHATVLVDIDGAATTGAGNVTVQTLDAQSSTEVNGFTVDSPPVVTSASPAAVGQGSSGTVDFVGTGFVSGMTVGFGTGGVTVGTVTVVDATTAHATVNVDPGAAPGPRAATATNPDGGTSATSGVLTINTHPTVTTASPSALGQGATARTVTINGSGFVTGAVVTFSGSLVTAGASAVAGDGLSLTVPVTVDPTAATGPRDVTVTNPDGGPGTASAGLTVNPKPVATSLTPAALGRGANGVTVTVAGSALASGAVVTFGGSGVTATASNFGSASSITAPVSVSNLAATGARTVTLTNPDGGTSTASGLFTVDAGPTVTSVVPSALTQGTTQVVTINGTGFVNPPTLALGRGLTHGTVTFVSATVLQVSVTVPTSTTSGAVGMSVTNPDNGVAFCGSCITVRMATYITMTRPASPIVYGATVTFSGRLTDRYTGHVLAGQIVVLYGKAYPNTVYADHYAVRTATDGTWRITIRPGADASYYSNFAGTSVEAPTRSGIVSVAVQVKVTMTSPANGASVRRGTIVFTGTTAPAKPGATVRLLQRLSNGSVVTLVTGTVASNGTIRLTRSLAAGGYVLSLAVSAYRGNEAGRSAYMSLHVT